MLCRPYSAGILHSVSDQMQYLPNYFTTPNKMTSENDIESLVSLKVQKIEIFFGFDFKFVLFLCNLCQNIKILQKNFLIGPFWAEVQFFCIVLRLRGIKIVFNLGQIIFFQHHI